MLAILRAFHVRPSLIVLGELAIHADGEAYGDEDQPARIEQPEPRHEFFLSGDLVVDMRGAIDQVGSGILKAAIRQFELIVRQLALLPKHPRQNNADGVNVKNIAKMIACSVVICRSLGKRTSLQSNSGISEKYSPNARIASVTLSFTRFQRAPRQYLQNDCVMTGKHFAPDGVTHKAS